ncbi:2'-5' RNA ligase family protein [Burkholderia gladioli]|uniref:2'-5' RNA ligase family protein n=1 Tax=Burkholderia gladioli TaxID=28095 RepID=UPI00163FF61F|nr:2'-5' RNA ligase family protein [Burkholderia gladioli]
MRSAETEASQLVLPGFDTGPWIPAHRFFFAVMPDPGAAARIARSGRQLAAEAGIGGRPHDAQRLHITLQLLGDFAYVPELALARARIAAASIRLPPFELTLDRLLSFKGRPGHWPLVIMPGAGLEALAGLQRQLASSLGRAGLRISNRLFTPHLTLLYGTGKLNQRVVEPFTWSVGEFVLIHSWLGKTRYDVMARWSLTGGAS